MRRSILFTFSLLLATSSQAQFKTRTEAIEAERRDQNARLWPESESPLVEQVNALVERGLYDGARSGKGANGGQIVLGGMRSGQGVSVGVGYRRTDLWRERIGFRGTARVTPQLAYLLDAELDFQGIATDKFFADLYVQIRELSPDGLLRSGSGLESR